MPREDENTVEFLEPEEFTRTSHASQDPRRLREFRYSSLKTVPLIYVVAQLCALAGAVAVAVSAVMPKVRFELPRGVPYTINGFGRYHIMAAELRRPVPEVISVHAAPLGIVGIAGTVIIFASTLSSWAQRSITLGTVIVDNVFVLLTVVAAFFEAARNTHLPQFSFVYGSVVQASGVALLCGAQFLVTGQALRLLRRQKGSRQPGSHRWRP